MTRRTWRDLNPTPFVVLAVLLIAIVLVVKHHGGSSDENSGPVSRPAPDVNAASGAVSQCDNHDGTYGSPLVNERDFAVPLGYARTYYYARGETVTFYDKDGSWPYYVTTCADGTTSRSVP